MDYESQFGAGHPAAPPLPPAAPPGASGRTPTQDEDIGLVSDYEAFAWNQVFTLVEPLPAPVFLDLLNAIIERQFDPDIRLRAMRMAAGVAEWVHDKFMRAHFGYDAPNGPPESEAASRDPHEVERHLILTSSLALEVGDPQFPRLAAGWLGVGSGVAGREAYFDVIECPQTVLKIVRQEAPGRYLRAVVHGRVEDAERLRPARASGQMVLSLDENMPVAECGVEAPAPFLDNLLELLRARPGKKAGRLASIIERMREGNHTKTDLGADYQYLRDNVPMLVRMLTGAGITARPSTPESGTRSPVSTQPWIVERIAGFKRWAHRYQADDLDNYGMVLKAGFETLMATEKSSYFSPGSAAANRGRRTWRPPVGSRSAS